MSIFQGSEPSIRNRVEWVNKYASERSTDWARGPPRSATRVKRKPNGKVPQLLHAVLWKAIFHLAGPHQRNAAVDTINAVQVTIECDQFRRSRCQSTTRPLRSTKSRELYLGSQVCCPWRIPALNRHSFAPRPVFLACLHPWITLVV